MNNYYYGKSGKGDYGRDDLPKNRWQLFREMLRVRIAGLFRLNLIAAVAWVPLIYVLAELLGDLIRLNMVLFEVEADAAAASAEYLDIYGNAAAYRNSLIFVALLKLIPCVALTGPFSAAMAWVARNWARDEHAFVWSDFKDAFKANWKQSLAVSLITGLIPLVLYVGWNFYGGLTGQSLVYLLPQMLMAVVGIVWALALTFMYPMLVTYKMGFMTVVKNSFLLAVGRLPQTAGVRLAALAPALVAAAVSLFSPYGMYALMALAGYYLLVGNALSRFVFASFTNGVFDRFINARIEGALVNRGLAEEDGDEAGEEDGADALAWQKEDAGKAPDPGARTDG